jgi:hypothetical protein
MGGNTQSKSRASVATDIITQAVMRNVTRCVTNASQDQSINISNTVGDVTLKNVLMSQSISINSQCMQQTLMNSDVQNSIVNDVVQSADTETQAMLGLLSGDSSSSSDLAIRTTIKNMFTMENINETVNNLKQNQSINISSTVGNVILENITMEQGLHLAAQTFVDSTQISKALADVENKIDQSSSSKSVGPFDFIADMFSQFGVIIGIVIIIIAIIVGGLLVFKWTSSGSTSASVYDIGAEAQGLAKGGYNYYGGVMDGAVCDSSD